MWQRHERSNYRLIGRFAPANHITPLYDDLRRYIYFILPLSRRAFSELILRHENEDLSDCAADEHGVVIDLHSEIQLDLLRSRDAARQHEDRLGRHRSPQGEAGLRGARDTRRRAHVHQRQGELYRRVGLMVTPHGEQLQLAGGRDRQHAHEGDVVVGVVRGRAQTSQVV